MDPLTRLADQRVLPILRGSEPAALADVVDAVVAGGFDVIELTLSSLDPIGDLRGARDRHPTAVLGMGTVLAPDQVREVHAAGADFVVTPVTDVAVIDAAVACGVPIIVGALSPTEVLVAHRSGAAAVKIFPAGRLGPGYLTDVGSVMPQVQLVPTGGIGEADIDDYLDNGAMAVGLGSSLTGPALRQEPEALAGLADRVRVMAGHWSRA